MTNEELWAGESLCRVLTENSSFGEIVTDKCCEIAAQALAAVRLEEREACAKLADERAAYWQSRPPALNHDGKPELGPSLHAFEDHALAAAIRNRA
ncbi:MAG: hypothetical protein NUW01_09685 [Gemmatimonadaceae bacterium]|nr:hypothetical protein [Gemmatimonadaceae bacterium]